MAKRRRTSKIMAKRRRTSKIMAKRRRTSKIMAKRKKRQRKNNDPQSIIQKNKYGAARSLLKPGGDL
jgi:hypothetical protein